MTPKEYWKRMRDAAEADDTGKGAAEVVKDYVRFAIGEIQKTCNGNDLPFARTQSLSFVG